MELASIEPKEERCSVERCWSLIAVISGKFAVSRVCTRTASQMQELATVKKRNVYTFFVYVSAGDSIDDCIEDFPL